MPSKPKAKARPVGRPKLHHAAKSHVVVVRLNAEYRKRLAATAEANGQTISEWIRKTLETALDG